MTYKLTINHKPTYLHVIVTGLNSRENVTQYLENVIEECRARDCFKVLIEERLEGPRLGTWDVFNVASGGGKQLWRVIKAMAYVDINREGDLMRFAETVAVNRGLPVAVFQTVAEAEKWLLDKDREAAKSHTAADVH